MQLLPGWHPLIVHFPLALITVAAVCLTLSRLMSGSRHAASLALVGTWNLCLGALFVFAALGTGLAAVIGLQVDTAARTAISLHVKSAILTTLLTLLTALWRGVGSPAASRPSWLFLLVLWAATGALTVTGYRGGQTSIATGSA